MCTTTVRTALAGAALSALLVVPAGTALAQADDRDCEDFAYQEDAQAFLDRYPDDPNNLDRNNDDVACEELPRRGTAVARDRPAGGIATGTGGTQITYLPSLAVAGGVALVAARVARVRRRRA